MQMVEDGVCLPAGFTASVGFSSVRHPTLGQISCSVMARRFLLKKSMNRGVYQLLGHRADGVPISDDAF